MATVFVSYRSSDRELATKLARELQAAGHAVWLDAWKVGIGDQIVEQINSGLALSAYLVLCYSSAGHAAWMSIEWQSALARQLNGERVKILPVRLTGDAAPAILAGTRYADLTVDWQRGVADLLKAIL